MRSPALMLDDQRFLNSFNRSKILDSVYSFPYQLRDAWEGSYETVVPHSKYLVNNVVFCGMGGSGMPGRVVDCLGGWMLKVPFETVNDFHLPAYVGLGTLVIAVSYSGNTEEVLNTVSEARERGAQIFCITRKGGKLSQIAKTYNLPGYFFDPRYNPSNQPRVGGGYLIMGTLGLLSKMELVDFNRDQADSVIHFLGGQNGNFGARVPYQNNPAKLLANSMWGKIPVIVSSGHLLGGAVYMRNMLHENGKNFACVFEIPELNHHLLEGLQFPVGNRNNLMFLFLESHVFHPETKERFKKTIKIVNENGISSSRFFVRSGKLYTEEFEIAQLSGYVSYYLATLNMVDPGPIPWVDYFKNLSLT